MNYIKREKLLALYDQDMPKSERDRQEYIMSKENRQILNEWYLIDDEVRKEKT